ncbi:helix-turn-helix domain-containing protein [Vulgatibacter sp.]|uniref:helix-turn-helix domain-containing protein n=1 Tax=Vulgatibacter sp. TaxID=1971226 RepID=UPI0035692B4A
MNARTKDLSNRIANRVRDLRLERGWSQPELARRSTLSNAMVSMVERGERTPSLEALAALASALDVDPAILLTVDETASMKADARRLAEELSDLKLPRADIEAIRRIARALAGDRDAAASRKQAKRA